MRQIVAVFVLVLGLSTCVWADDPNPMQYVDLNAPGALERLEASDPKTYWKLTGILDGLSHRSFSEVPHWMGVNFDAKEVSYSLYVLTSYPPKRDLSFTVDNTRYFGRITLAPEGAQVLSTKVR